MIPPAMCTKVPLAKDSAPGGVDVVEKGGGQFVLADVKIAFIYASTFLRIDQLRWK